MPVLSNIIQQIRNQKDDDSVRVGLLLNGDQQRFLFFFVQIVIILHVAAFTLTLRH